MTDVSKLPGFSPDQHCTRDNCMTLAHTANYCGYAQPRFCPCGYCYEDLLLEDPDGAPYPDEVQTLAAMLGEDGHEAIIAACEAVRRQSWRLTPVTFSCPDCPDWTTDSLTDLQGHLLAHAQRGLR